MDAYIALFQAIAKPLLICLVTASALVGLLALVSPRVFLRLLTIGNYSVDTQKLLRIPDWRLFRVSDKWIDTDRHAARFSRLTGIAILSAVAILSSIYLLA